MKVFAKFDEIPSMTLIKGTDYRSVRQMGNMKTVYPPESQFVGGINTGLQVDLFVNALL